MVTRRRNCTRASGCRRRRTKGLYCHYCRCAAIAIAIAAVMLVLLFSAVMLVVQFSRASRKLKFVAATLMQGKVRAHEVHAQEAEASMGETGRTVQGLFGLEEKSSENAEEAYKQTRCQFGTFQCPETHVAFKNRKATYFHSTLLVIHFNYIPCRCILPFLLKVYSSFFPNIVTVAPSRIPDGPLVPHVICDDEGKHVQACYHKAMKRFEGFRGYLIVNDDSVFNPERCMYYNRDAWWSIRCGGRSEYMLTESMAEQFKRFPERWHWAKLDGVIHWWNSIASAEMKQKYIAYMNGSFAPRPCQADIAYVPQRMVPFYLNLSKQMPHVFLELFAPMVDTLWKAMGEKVVEIPKTQFYYDWSPRRGSRQRLRQMEHNYHVAMYHPLKLGYAEVRDFAAKWLSNASF